MNMSHAGGHAARRKQIRPKSRQYDQAVLTILTAPVGILNTLEIRFRVHCRGWNLNNREKSGSPFWSRARTLYKILTHAQFDMSKLHAIYERGSITVKVTRLARDDIRRMLKRSDPVFEESKAERAIISDLLSFSSARQTVKRVGPIQFQRAMSHGILPNNFCPVILARAMVQQRVSLAQNRCITYCLVAMLTHYFPMRGSTVSCLKVDDVRQIAYKNEVAVITFQNNKTGQTVDRGIPAWYGHLLQFYVSHFRPKSSSDLVFIDPTTGNSIQAGYTLIGQYLQREFQLLKQQNAVGPHDYIGGNLKRKVFETCIARDTYNDLGRCMEHGSKAGKKHYEIALTTTAVLLYKAYLNAFADLCESEEVCAPPEWDKIINTSKASILCIINEERTSRVGIN